MRSSLKQIQLIVSVAHLKFQSLRYSVYIEGFTVMQVLFLKKASQKGINEGKSWYFLLYGPNKRLHGWKPVQRCRLYGSGYNFILSPTKVECCVVTTINFIYVVGFFFCSHWNVRLKKQLTQSFFGAESGSYFVRSGYKL